MSQAVNGGTQQTRSSAAPLSWWPAQRALTILLGGHATWFTDGTTSQSMMQDNLRQRHLCCTSTAPDTLACFPFVSNDPFILSECPHVYFAGNHGKLSAEAFRRGNGQEVVTVAAPAFARTGTVVFLNLRTLETKPMSFHASL